MAHSPSGLRHLRQSLRNAFKKSSAKRRLASWPASVSPACTASARIAELPLRRGLDDNTSAFIVLSSQEFGGGLVECPLERRYAPRRTGAMAPRRLEDAKFGVLHLADFRRVVFGREIHVGAARHHDRPRLNRLQRAGEVAAVDRVIADIAVLPRPDLGDQVVRV